MAITNAMIIANAQEELYRAGKLKLTGRTFRVRDLLTDEVREIPEIEDIHTYKMWQSLGYQVRKGETAVAKLTIWKYAAKKKKDNDAPQSLTVNPGDGDGETGHCFMKQAAFFAASQVEKIEKKTA